MPIIRISAETKKRLQNIWEAMPSLKINSKLEGSTDYDLLISGILIRDHAFVTDAMKFLNDLPRELLLIMEQEARKAGNIDLADEIIKIVSKTLLNDIGVTSKEFGRKFALGLMGVPP